MKNLVTLKSMLIFLFTVMSMVMNAENIGYTTDDGFKYNLNTETKTAALSGYTGSATEVAIPESVTHEGIAYSLTSLGDWCFRGCSSLTSVTIPSSVTSLGEYCFKIIMFMHLTRHRKGTINHENEHNVATIQAYYPPNSTI